MRLLAPGPARGRGRGRRAGVPRCGLSPPWSPAWICCWALAGCRAAWAGDLPPSSSGRPLPPCLEVSRTWSFTWSLRGRGRTEREARGEAGARVSLLAFLGGRGLSCVAGMKLPAPGGWPTEGVWLCCLWGDAFLFALLL